MIRYPGASIEIPDPEHAFYSQTLPYRLVDDKRNCAPYAAPATWHHSDPYSAQELHQLVRETTNLPEELVLLTAAYCKPIDLHLPRTYVIKEEIAYEDAVAIATAEGSNTPITTLQKVYEFTRPDHPVDDAAGTCGVRLGVGNNIPRCGQIPILKCRTMTLRSQETLYLCEQHAFAFYFTVTQQYKKKCSAIKAQPAAAERAPGDKIGTIG